MIAKDVVKNKMINVAGQLFIEYEKELDESQQIIKTYENYIGDINIKKDILKNFFRITKHSLKIMISIKIKQLRHLLKF